jgi:RNA polymerase sigma factor (sigma-70 family)
VFEPSTGVDARVDRRVGRGRVSSEELAEHEGLVRWVVRRQRLGGLLFEDAVQAGQIGLWHALRAYDPTRGTRFSTYAVVAISRAIWRAVAEHQPPISAPPMPADQDRHLALAVDLPDPSERLHRGEVHAELYRLVGTLPPRLGLVVVAHYGLGSGLGGSPPQTFAQIGEVLGVTRQRVQQLHVDALLWLAQPAHSLPLRELLQRGRRLDYQQTLARQAHWRQTRRGHAGRAPRSHAR